MSWRSWYGPAVSDVQHTDMRLLLTVPTVEREPEEPPPFVVLVQGPPQVHSSFCPMWAHVMACAVTKVTQSTMLALGTSMLCVLTSCPACVTPQRKMQPQLCCDRKHESVPAAGGEVPADPVPDQALHAAVSERGPRPCHHCCRQAAPPHLCGVPPGLTLLQPYGSGHTTHGNGVLASG